MGNHVAVGFVDTAPGRFAVPAQIARVGVLVADRADLTRLGLLALMRDARPEWQTTEADCFADLHAHVHLASLIVVDLDLPGLDGISGIRRLHTAHPGRCVVVLSDSDDRETILACLGAGAQGYIPKSTNATQILQAIDTVLEGGIHVPARLTMASTRVFARLPGLDADIAGALSRMTERQHAVFQLLQEGFPTKTIARRLDLAVGTVKIHLTAIYRALGVHGRLEALALAHRAAGYAIG